MPLNCLFFNMMSMSLPLWMMKYTVLSKIEGNNTSAEVLTKWQLTKWQVDEKV
jgi:hypothetical protein